MWSALWRHRRLCFCGIFGLLVLAGYVCRGPVLRGLAEAWIVDEKPQKADAIVVLGGGLEYRPFAAAELYKQGFAPKVLIMDVRLSPTEEIGIKEPERSVVKLILLRQGVPNEGIVRVGQAVKNTYDESLAVREWAQNNGAKRLLITTEIFHTRRVRWLFKKRFQGTETEIKVVAAQPREYGKKDWWKCEEGLIAFQNEICKSVYYHIKY